MNKETAFKTIKNILVENGIEFAEYFDYGICVKVGRIKHFFQFTERSMAIISSVEVGKNDIVTTHIDRWYENVVGFRFREGSLWLDDNTLGYMTIEMEQGI